MRCRVLVATLPRGFRMRSSWARLVCMRSARWLWSGPGAAFPGSLPGDDAGQRIGLGGATHAAGVAEFVERGAPVGVWCGHACICFMRRRARSAAALARVLPRTGTVNRGVPGLLRRKGGSQLTGEVAVRRRGVRGRLALAC